MFGRLCGNRLSICRRNLSRFAYDDTPGSHAWLTPSISHRGKGLDTGGSFLYSS